MRAQPFRLVPFAALRTPSHAVSPPLEIEIAGSVALTAATLDVIYRVHGGAADRVKFAAAADCPSRKDELWRSTCFELFLMLPGGAEYWEYNLSPSGDWNAYHFTHYRSPLEQEACIAGIDLSIERVHSHVAGMQATLPLPPPCRNRKLAVGISSVIEDAEGNMHYFALGHSGVKPDFHDPAGFVLSIDPASA